ncbi:unnamed protein product [Fraxinus pennsylvanica]|uniref:Uncharacterized protein n=1 Tax=Fraxinus pennsylvanica TaxID=56036 RepID=A0AAD2E320_9LAMI|nr:unnamed protein product [Fraxinus pennsylvanica]
MALKLAASRLKLLRNKKEVPVLRLCAAQAFSHERIEEEISCNSVALSFLQTSWVNTKPQQLSHGCCLIESEEDSRCEFDTSSDSKDAGTFLDDNSELEGSEVDRKADEFIAKFREQIRLQKIASAKGNGGC